MMLTFFLIEDDERIAGYIRQRKRFLQEQYKRQMQITLIIGNKEPTDKPKGV